MLMTEKRRELDHHRPVCQGGLRRQEDATVPAMAELRPQMEIPYRFANVGIRGSRADFQDLLAVEQDLQLRLPLRETAQDLRPRDLLAILPSKADLFIDKINRCLRVIPELRVERQVIFSQRTVS